MKRLSAVFALILALILPSLAAPPVSPLPAGLISPFTPPSSKISDGFSVDSNGYLLINAAGGSGTQLSNGLRIDSSGNLYVNCAVGCSAGGGGTVTSFAAPSASWPSWLVPTVTNSTSTPSLAVTASSIPNTALGTLAAHATGAVGATAGGTGDAIYICLYTSTSSAAVWSANATVTTASAIFFSRRYPVHGASRHLLCRH